VGNVKTPDLIDSWRETQVYATCCTPNNDIWIKAPVARDMSACTSMDGQQYKRLDGFQGPAETLLARMSVGELIAEDR
jgi:hypothetical protein